MTAATVVPRNAELLLPRLVRVHTHWRREVAATLGPARQANAGPWARWAAIEYLRGAFPARVVNECRLVQAMAADMSPPDAERLWALGELLELLPKYLSRSVGLCHRAQEFSELTARITTALERWCQAVEATLGSLPVTVLPEDMPAEFAEPI